MLPVFVGFIPWILVLISQRMSHVTNVTKLLPVNNGSQPSSGKDGLSETQIIYFHVLYSNKYNKSSKLHSPIAGIGTEKITAKQSYGDFILSLALHGVLVLQAKRLTFTHTWIPETITQMLAVCSNY